MILYLIRHAESENNALATKIRAAAGQFDEFSFDDYRYNRTSEPSLTELGFEQAEILARYVKTATPKHRAGFDDPGDIEPGEFEGNPFGITRIYCSPMLRTLQTTQPLSKVLGLRPRVWVDIHEHGGIFDNSGEDRSVVGQPGLNRRQINEQFPDCDLPQEITEEGWWFGKEEDHATCQGRAVRVSAELRKMAIEAEHERIALVSHGTFLDSLLKALTGRLPGNEFHYGLYNTSITRLDFTHSAETKMPFTVIRYTNRVDHLPHHLIT
jgi:2,3-bisphosphoglycerate-dependent phosphoglycerate mutase